MPNSNYSSAQAVVLEKQYLAITSWGAVASGTAGNGQANAQSVNTLLGASRHPKRQTVIIANNNDAGNTYLRVQAKQAPTSEQTRILQIGEGQTEAIQLGYDADLYIWGSAAGVEYTIAEGV